MKWFEYNFEGELWKHPGKGGWHFITLPTILSETIRSSHKTSEGGWGRLTAKVQIGQSIWESAIWFDTKANSYFLPVKASVRMKEKIRLADTCSVLLKVKDSNWL